MSLADLAQIRPCCCKRLVKSRIRCMVEGQSSVVATLTSVQQAPPAFACSANCLNAAWDNSGERIEVAPPTTTESVDEPLVPGWGTAVDRAATAIALAPAANLMKDRLEISLLVTVTLSFQ